SRVWLHADFSEGILKFTADSDALITKGLVALMIRVLSGHTPKSIAEADIYFIERIGLQNHLSPSRANGLLSMLKQMKLYAVAIEAKNSL
ncbi:MAG TPA: SufE family protein, partial [Ferruginibacter sp.]|nr:SufE family protein [Ferruginibacter sp.]